VGFGHQKRNRNHRDNDDQTDTNWKITETKKLNCKPSQCHIHNSNQDDGSQVANIGNGFFGEISFGSVKSIHLLPLLSKE